MSVSWPERAKLGPHGASRRDWTLVAFVAIAVVVALFAVLPAAFSLRLSSRYQTYVQDLTQSVRFGEKNNSAEIICDGERQVVLKAQLSDAYRLVIDAGMGRPRDEAPEDGGTTIYFGDGSTLELWPVEITERSRESDTGTLLRYVGADGRVFSYDTDHLQYEDVLEALGVTSQA
jgi:hypothetical protein